MPKQENQKETATQQQRVLADMLRKARKHAAEWNGIADSSKDSLRATMDGRTDITLVTEKGDEVASVTESDPRQGVDWKAFRAAHPDLDYDKYLKPATTTVTVLTQWTEEA